MGNFAGFQKDPHSEGIPFDAGSTDLVSDRTGPAIRELREIIDTAVANSASPGFTWGKGGSAGSGEYLDNDGVESNKAGRLVPFDGFVTEFFVNNEKTSGSKILELRRRRPCQTGSFQTIATITVPGGQACGTFNTDDFGTVEVLKGDELSVRVSNSSQDFENPIVGIVIKTSNSSSGGGGGSLLEVQDDGVTIDASVGILNFTGPGVTATQTVAGEVEVNIPGGGGGGGESNDGNNVGSGADIFRDKTGVNLNFRGILGSADINAVVSGDNIELSLTNPPDLDVNRHASGVEVAGGLNVVGGWTPITLDTNTSSATGVATHANGLAPITIVKTGWYLVNAGVTLEQTGGNSRSQVAMRVLQNAAVIPGSFKEFYSRNNGQGGDNGSFSHPVFLNAGDTVTLQAQRVNGGGTIVVAPNSAFLSVTYLRSSN